MEGWIAVSRSAHVCNHPKIVPLRGSRYVTWRTPQGQVRFLPDACKHRGASLSRGTVEPNGCLKCVYHGWQYDDAGYSTFDGHRTGFTDTRDLLYTREQDGLLWVTAGPAADPPKAPVDDMVWIEHWIDQCAQLVMESWLVPTTELTLPYTVQFEPNIMISICPLTQYSSKVFIGFSRKDGVPLWLFDIINKNKQVVEQIDHNFCFKGEIEPFIRDYRLSLWSKVWR